MSAENIVEKLRAVHQSLEQILDILHKGKVDPDLQALACKVIYRKIGIELPFEIEEKEYFFSAEQIAEKLGVYTNSKKPAVAAVSSIIKKLILKDSEKKIVWESNNSWTGTIEKYTGSVIKKCQDWLENKGYPASIPGEGDSDKPRYYHVTYRREESLDARKKKTKELSEQIKLDI